MSSTPLSKKEKGIPTLNWGSLGQKERILFNIYLVILKVQNDYCKGKMVSPNSISYNILLVSYIHISGGRRDTYIPPFSSSLYRYCNGILNSETRRIINTKNPSTSGFVTLLKGFNIWKNWVLYSYNL